MKKKIIIFTTTMLIAACSKNNVVNESNQTTSVDQNKNIVITNEAKQPKPTKKKVEKIKPDYSLFFSKYNDMFSSFDIDYDQILSEIEDFDTTKDKLNNGENVPDEELDVLMKGRYLVYDNKLANLKKNFPNSKEIQKLGKDLISEFNNNTELQNKLLNVYKKSFDLTWGYKHKLYRQVEIQPETGFKITVIHDVNLSDDFNSENKSLFIKYNQLDACENPLVYYVTNLSDEFIFDYRVNYRAGKEDMKFIVDSKFCKDSAKSFK